MWSQESKKIFFREEGGLSKIQELRSSSCLSRGERPQIAAVFPNPTKAKLSKEAVIFPIPTTQK